MFKEVFDTLGTIDLKVLTTDQKAEYYTLMGRCYYDLADYDHDDFYAPWYNSNGNHYLDSALQLFHDSSFEYIYYSGLKNIRSGQLATALNYLHKLMQRKNLSLHEFALTASTLSDIYIRKGQTDTAIDLLVRAAMADIRSSTKETSAIFNLASLLFKRGEIQRASVYIQKAVSDAVFYGARQRKVQLSAILPLIEAEKINRVENQKQILITYAAGATFMLLVVIALAIVIFRQVNKLKLAKKIITDAKDLQQNINNKLTEANKIKEEYIGYFFNANSDFFAKIERFKKSVDQKIGDRKFDEIKFLVNNINLKQEKEEQLKNFDKVFLKLFPDFVVDFNSLFRKEDQMKIKDNELLTTDLRIFALIRMGIHDNEKIARILEYSVNTVYTYKTKIKNKSIVPNDEFEHRIMDINTM
jgi:tetratricopeptide (TPR) repeat protein